MFKIFAIGQFITLTRANGSPMQKIGPFQCIRSEKQGQKGQTETWIYYKMQFFFVLQKKNMVRLKMCPFFTTTCCSQRLNLVAFPAESELKSSQRWRQIQKEFSSNLFLYLFFLLQSKTPHFNCYTLGDKFHMQLLKLRIKMELLRTKKLENLNLMMREASLCYLKT